MRKFFLTLFAGSLLVVQARAQKLNIDSLKTELSKNSGDTNAVNICRMLTGLLMDKDPGNAILYGKKGVALGRELKFDKGTAGCYLNLSVTYSRMQKLDSGLFHIDSAIWFSHRAGDPNRLALAYLNRADLFMQVRDLVRSIRDCDTALVYAERANNPDRLARINQTIGSVYFIQGNYHESRNYYDRANHLYRELGNYAMSAVVLNNIGNIFKHTGPKDSAISSFETAIHIADSIGEVGNLAMYYGNLSDALLQDGQLERAETAAEKSLEYAKQKGGNIQLAHTYQYFSEIYLKQKKYTQAIDAGYQALEAANAEGDLELRTNITDLLAEAYYASGDFREGYKYLELSKDLQDSLSLQKYDEDIAALQTKFKMQEKEQEIVLLSKENEIASQRVMRQRTLIVAGIILVILAIIGILLLVNRNRLRQRMKEMQIRQQIAADLHDEVGSSLSSIHMLSQMAVSQGEKTGKSSEILGRVAGYTRETMEKMGDILWMIKPSEHELQSLKERMQRFLAEICESRKISSNFEWQEPLKAKLSMKQKKAVYLVFKEAVNNAAKYSSARQIDVYFSEHDDKVRLQVTDDGNGFDPLLSYQGNGLGNMKTRATELKGKTTIESRPGFGTRIIFEFPANA